MVYKPYMDKKNLICYVFEKINPIKRKQFDRELFGTTEKSHGGKYVATTKGLLSDKNFRKPVKSTILIETEDLKEVSKILKKYGAIYEVFKVLN